MRNEVGLAVEMICRVVAYTEINAVRSIKERAATMLHWLASLVEVWSFDILRTAIDGLIGRFLATAAVVEAYEEIIVIAMLEDERCLYGICSSMVLLPSLVNSISESLTDLFTLLEMVTGLPIGVWKSFFDSFTSWMPSQNEPNDR